jgi:DNA-binding protein HU-beta
MNKADLIEAIATSADISKASAGRALDAVLDNIVEALQKGDVVSLSGFGSFKVVERAAREGRNPSNGESIHIPASRIPKFSVGKNFRDAVN